MRILDKIGELTFRLLAPLLAVLFTISFNINKTVSKNETNIDLIREVQLAHLQTHPDVDIKKDLASIRESVAEVSTLIGVTRREQLRRTELFRAIDRQLQDLDKKITDTH